MKKLLLFFLKYKENSKIVAKAFSSRKNLPVTKKNEKNIDATNIISYHTNIIRVYKAMECLQEDYYD